MTSRWQAVRDVARGQSAGLVATTLGLTVLVTLAVLAWLERAA